MAYKLKTPESYSKKLAKFLKSNPVLITPYKKPLRY